MYLKSIIIDGFKSFPDKKEFIIDHGITGIVGPNGSGKSNVADAVRWVLGEQSAKQLRGSKMLDVIFGGSINRKQRSYCEVSLIFDNSSSMLSTDFSEVHITRKLYRSGESDYFINKTQCRLKDILEMFRDTGVGKEGYSIIGQGKIDEILTEKSTERRKIFEEAAGIMKYRVRKEEAERKLDRTHDNLVRVTDILNELESQIEPLKEQCEETKRYMALAERLKMLEINVYLDAYDKHSEKIAAFKATIDALTEEEHILRKRLEELEANTANQEEESQQIDDHIGSLNAEITAFQRDVERLDGEIKLSNERIAYFKRDIDRLTEEIQHAEAEIAQKRTIITQLTEENSAADIMQTELQDSIFEQQNRLTESVIALEQERNLLNDAKNGVFENLGALSDIKSDISAAETARNSAELRLADIRNRLKTAETEINAINDSEQRLSEAIEAAVKASEEKKQSVLSLSKRYAEKEGALSKATSELYDIEKKLEGVSSRRRLLSEMRDGFEGYFNSVKNLLKSAESRPDLKNKMINTVASAISVPEKFETSIEVALGNAMQNIIVNREEDARDLIEYLKQKDLGRVTFLPLNALKQRYLNDQEKRSLNDHGVLGIASDLIEFNGEVKSAVEYLLARTVIVDNINNAIALMKKTNYTFRTVTLDGGLLNPGGVITGGSLRRTQTSLLSRERVLSELETQEKKLTHEADAIRITFIALGEEIRRVGEQKTEADEVERKNELEAAALTEKVNALREKRSTLVQQVDALKSVEKEISDELAGSAAKATELLDKKALLMGTGDETDERIKSLEDQYNLKASEIDALKEALSRDKITLAEKKKERDAKQAELKRYEQEIAQSQLDIKRKQKQIEVSKNGIIDIENGIESMKTALKEKEALAEEKQAALNAALQQRGEVRELVKGKMTEKESLHAQIEAASEKKHRADLNISKVESNLEFSQNRIWDKYQLTYVNALKFKEEIVLTKANREIQEIKESIRGMGDVNPHAVEDYDKLTQRFNFLNEQKVDLVKASEDLKTVIDGLMVKMKENFEEKFRVINQNFKSVFKQLFGGGHVDLVLEDKTNIMESGIQIVAEPPGKHLQNIMLLSGGEKALTAIALLFALLNINPSPLCILDEIDSALDDANTNKFAEYLRAFTNETQFIIITHRKPSMAICDVLYGLAMEEKGVTEVLSVSIG